MGAYQSKKAFKAALKKRRMDKLPKGQRSSSGGVVNNLPKRSTSRPPSLRGSTPNSPLPATANNSSTRKTPLRASGKGDSAPRKAFGVKSKSPSDVQRKQSPASFQDRVLQKTSSVSPAPATHLRSKNTSNLTRFGFKNTSRPSSLLTSGDSSDSVNSILSDAQINSDSYSNSLEDNGNVVNDCKSVSSKNSFNLLDNRIITDRSSSPCAISEASSGVTSAIINREKITAQEKLLPEPQTVAVKAVISVKQQVGSTSPSVDRRDKVVIESSPVMPKLNLSKIPQTKSSLLKSQKTARDFESSNKSLNTLDSGLGSSSESDRVKIKVTNPEKKLRTKEEQEAMKAKFELDVSDAWLEGKKNKNGTPFKIEVAKKTPLKDSFKDTNIAYGNARQKFAPYSKGRITYKGSFSNPQKLTNSHPISNSKTVINAVNNSKRNKKSIDQLSSNIATNEIINTSCAKSEVNGIYDTDTSPVNIITNRGDIDSNSIKVFGNNKLHKAKIDVDTPEKLSIPSPKFSKTGNVKSRIQLIEKTPTPGQKLSEKRAVPKKLFTRSTTLEKTPVVTPSAPEGITVEVRKNVFRRLEYSEGKGLLKQDRNNSETTSVLTDSSPTPHDVLVMASCEGSKAVTSPVEKCSTSRNSGESKTMKDISESEKPPSKQNVLNEDESFLDSKMSSTDSECSFEISDSPVPRMRNFIRNLNTGEQRAKVPTSLPLLKVNYDQKESTAVDDVSSDKNYPPLQELCIREDDDEEVVHPLTLSNMSSSTCSSKTSMNDPYAPTPRLNDSCERWSASGKGTPIITSHRGDMDHDFLIDDEIADQPDLIFADDELADDDDDIFEDQDLFPDLPLQSPTPFAYNDHLESPMEVSNRSFLDRSRHESHGTISSLGGDDLMLDFDTDEQKCSLGQNSQPMIINKPRARRRYSEITIPGPRYEEEVSSPAASAIYDEWTTMLAHVRDERSSCVTDDPVIGISSISGSVPNGTISTQPSHGLDLHHRARTSSATECDYKKGVLFKPPRQGPSVEQDQGINLDRTNFHYICQDVTAMKTLLFKLRRVLQVADTVNPFDIKISPSYVNLDSNAYEGKSVCKEKDDAAQENVDLQRQVVLLQQRLEEKDRSIHILQQQLSQALHANNSFKLMSNSLDSRRPVDSLSVTTSSVTNAATQTERSSHRSPTTLSSISLSSSSEDDGLGPTVR